MFYDWEPTTETARGRQEYGFVGAMRQPLQARLILCFLNPKRVGYIGVMENEMETAISGLGSNPNSYPQGILMLCRRCDDMDLCRGGIGVMQDLGLCKV